MTTSDPAQAEVVPPNDSDEQVVVPYNDGNGHNTHEVPPKTWARWSPLSRRVFTALFSIYSANQWMLNAAPEACELTDEQWRVVSWNAAWLAADTAQKASEELGPKKVVLV